jgi:TPR repeat protein
MKRLIITSIILLFIPLTGYCSDEDYNLAVSYIENRKFSKAIPLLEKLSSKGDRDAMSNLGALYEHGYGVPKSLKKAASLYLKSARLGSPVGQLNIGALYFNGKGVKRNKIEGHAWLMMASSGALEPAIKTVIKSKRYLSKGELLASEERFVELNEKYGLLLPATANDTFRIK